MSSKPTYSELMAKALGLDPATATERELVIGQMCANRRARAEWIVRTMDRVHCRPVLTGDPHDILELVARGDWPHPLL